MTDYYQEYQLNGALRPYIDCVWMESYTQLPENIGRSYLVAPDHTVELIFTVHPIERRCKHSNQEKHALRSHISGLKTKPQEIVVTGETILSVRFRPEAFYPFVRADIQETVDRSIPAFDLFGNEIRTLEEQLLEADTRLEQVKRVERFFLKKLSPIEKQQDYKFNFLVRKIQRLKGNIKIAALAKEAKVSVKTIERKFLQYLGILPKQYCRIIRFCHIVKQVSRTGLFTAEYYDSFYDQNHFIKELKHFTGLTPGEYFHMDKGVQHPIFST
jgi:AraC-like DNA-binding protein